MLRNISILAFVLSSASAFAQFRTITVQNSNSNPVPTNIQNTPSVNIANTPSVSATITGTPDVNVANVPAVTISGIPSVSITGTPTVSVMNLPTGTAGPANTTGILVKSLDNPALQPFQKLLECIMSFPGPSCTATYTVPAGKILTIEYIQTNFQESGIPNLTPSYRLDTTVAGNGVSYIYLAPPAPNEHLVRIYADPGTSVTFTGNGSAGTSTPGSIDFTVILSGYLVNVP